MTFTSQVSHFVLQLASSLVHVCRDDGRPGQQVQASCAHPDAGGAHAAVQRQVGLDAARPLRCQSVPDPAGHPPRPGCTLTLRHAVCAALLS